MPSPLPLNTFGSRDFAKKLHEGKLAYENAKKLQAKDVVVPVVQAEPAITVAEPAVIVDTQIEPSTDAPAPSMTLVYTDVPSERAAEADPPKPKKKSKRRKKSAPEGE